MPRETGSPVVQQHASRSREIGRWASRHYGVVTRRKLEALGLTAAEIRHLQAAGWLLKRHEGVYVVGHLAFVPGQREALALAASGPGAALGAESAASWRGLIERYEGPVRLIVPPSRDGALRGATRSAASLPSLDVASHRGLATTTVERTLLDLPSQHLPQAMVEALRRGIALEPLEARVAGRRGAKAFRAELHALDPGLAHTLSELEARFLRLLHAHGIAAPEVNVAFGRELVDCSWPAAQLAVELDGRRWHEHRFQQDRERDDRRVLQGLRTLRFTWRDLVDRPWLVLEQVRAALEA